MRILRLAGLVAGWLALLVAPLPAAAHRLAMPPPPPPRVAGGWRVAAANLDNYFSTPADGAHACAPRQVAADCRGARDASGIARQRARIVAMLEALDADVVALMEVENNGDTALRTLVDALNAHAGAAAWAAIGEGAAQAGGDAVRVALIYRPARVVPVGAARADLDPVHHRPPFSQAFAAADGSGRFNLVANHFKSRRCDGAADAELDDGRGCFNARRVAQARALARFARSVARDTGVADTVLVGDFNTRAREPPASVLVAAGFADATARFEPRGWSYVFHGVAERLDGVFASASMAERLRRVATWHVNTGQPLSAPWRASDHDPVIVDMGSR